MASAPTASMAADEEMARRLYQEEMQAQAADVELERDYLLDEDGMGMGPGGPSTRMAVERLVDTEFFNAFADDFDDDDLS
mmetsp:Transcript_40245/g.111853  ORF Transcript_40245/g.111853 Transcript_40245/m.111853 type:complete len:80 (-) Transcript_40245:190-429(-)